MPNVHWVIDILSMRDSVEELVDCLRSAGNGYTLFAHTDTVPVGKALGRRVFFYGGVDAANYFKANGYDWFPGVMYDQSHYSYYQISQRIPKHYLLNDDATCRTVGFLKKNWSNIQNMFDSGKIFVRPNFPFNEFPSFVSDDISSNSFYDVSDSTSCMISSAKVICEEYRVFAAGDRVVTGSSTKIGGCLAGNMRVPEDVSNFALSMARLFRYDRIYALDLAVVPKGGIKLVDISPISCSKFYGASKPRIIEAINDLRL